MRLPLFLLIWGIGSIAMFLPAAHALILNDHATSRAFFYSGTLGLVCVTLIALAKGTQKSRYSDLGQVLALLGTFALLPVFLALPLHDVLRTTSFLNAYFDMVSAITTTGANLFRDPTRLNGTLHLWRAEVGWLGGLLMWVAASAILAPMSLGGFEVTARGEPGRGADGATRKERADPRKRLLQVAASLVPIYVGLTLVIWTLLLISGEQSLTGLCHAMSVMATSGISPVGGPQNGNAGIAGEAILLLFMFFALSRLTFSGDTATRGYSRLDRDPEFRTGVLMVLAVSLILFMRHWIGAAELDTVEDTESALSALWGNIFTVMSFLTTTGFVSADWEAAQLWSGLGSPGLILLGLALIGGGVATTAGGVKLLRVYALYLNGLREMERLVYPSSVSSAVAGNRRIQSNGAFIAWIFFMLFALSLTLVTLTLTGLGVDFESAIVLSIASLSTTGPLIEAATETPISLVDLGAASKLVLCGAMVLGRLEMLAIIALLTRDLWRD